MGRPPVGAAAKNAVIACRVTDHEKAILAARYGKPAEFLRRKIDEEMQKEAKHD